MKKIESEKKIKIIIIKRNRKKGGKKQNVTQRFFGFFVCLLLGVFNIPCHIWRLSRRAPGRVSPTHPGQTLQGKQRRQGKMNACRRVQIKTAVFNSDHTSVDVYIGITM